MADDGLLDPTLDVDWIVDTSSVPASPETYLLITRILGWDLDRYEQSLAEAMTRLADRS